MSGIPLERLTKLDAKGKTRVWEVEVQGPRILIRTGTQGQRLATKAIDLPDERKAKLEAEKRWREKLNKGGYSTPPKAYPKTIQPEVDGEDVVVSWDPSTNDVIWRTPDNGRIATTDRWLEISRTLRGLWESGKIGVDTTLEGTIATTEFSTRPTLYVYRTSLNHVDPLSLYCVYFLPHVTVNSAAEENAHTALWKAGGFLGVKEIASTYGSCGPCGSDGSDGLDDSEDCDGCDGCDGSGCKNVSSS